MGEDGAVVVTPVAIPHDSCGWLAEARGKPFADVVEAVFSLNADCHRLTKLAEQHQIKLCDDPVMEVPRAVRLEAQRKYEKGLIKYNNLYGHTDHKTKGFDATAGVHVSFTCPSFVHSQDGKTIEYNSNFDWPAIFLALDDAFEEEIKGSQRHQGFYELKEDGRVEYRSLPSNVDMEKLIDVLQSILTK